MSTSGITAVLFDFGGVITSSPFEAFNALEEKSGVPLDTIRTINATNPDTNAWAKLERSEVSLAEFGELFEAEAAEMGYALSGADVLDCLSGGLRPQMVRALDLLTAGGCRIGCITNNVRKEPGDARDDASATRDDASATRDNASATRKNPNPAMARNSDDARRVAAVMDRFEIVVQSSEEGLRKPDPRIYQLALDRMGLAASQTAYLDDLGINCKPARMLGMSTIKVIDPDVALDELEQLVGFALR